MAAALVDRPFLRAQHCDQLDDIAREGTHVVMDIGELRDATGDQIDGPSDIRKNQQ